MGQQLTYGGVVDWAVSEPEATSGTTTAASAKEAPWGLHVVGEVHGAAALDGAVAASPAELLVSGQAALGAFRVMLGGGAGLTDSVGSPAWRAFAGVGYAFAQVRDRDGDGVLDVEDACIDRPEDKDGYMDSDGCPDDDNDGDGIPDVADKCPNVAEDRDGFQDDDGCPDPDNDGDGIPDATDKCPDRPEDKDGFQDDDGCPDPDNDGDGVLDALDKCPLEPETQNGFQDDDGCPDTAPAYVFKSGERIVFHNILFKTGAWDILPESFATLDDIAKSLASQPDVKVRIEGHTDDVGKAKDNLLLSQQRALAVVNYLVQKGVDSRRLGYAGFGDTRPVAALPVAVKGKPVDAKLTDDARAQNRRVEFVTLDAAP